MNKTSRNATTARRWYTTDLALAISLSIITFLSAYPFASCGIDAHQMYMFKPALDMARGCMLFRDTFTQYGALTIIMQAASLRMFGETVLTLNILTVCFYVLITPLLFYLWLNFLPRWLAYFCGLIHIGLAPYYLMTMLPWSSVYALFFLVASFLFVSRFLKAGHAHDAILAGVCAACTFWCRQPVGVFLLFSYILYFLVLWILKQRNRSEGMKMMLGLGAGFFGVSAVIIVWIVANGALNDWWLQSFVHATAWQKNHDGSLRYIFESLLAVPLEEAWYRMHVGFMIPVWTIMPLVCLVVCIVFTIVPVVRKRIAFPPSILVLGGLSYVSMASWLQYYPVTCFRHIYWSAAPMTGIVAYMAMRLIRGSRPQAACNDMRFALAVIVVLTAFYARDVQVRLRIGINHLAQPLVVIQAPGFLKGMRELPVVATAAGDLDRQVNILRSQSPGIGIAVKGELANIMCLAYLSHRPGENPGIRTLFLNWGGYDNCNVYPDYEAAISRYIADTKPMVIHRVGETLVLPGYGENRCWQPLRFCMEIPDGMTK